MFYEGEAYGEQRQGEREAWIGVLSCLPRIFLFLSDFNHINLIDLLWDNQFICKSF